LALAAAEEDEKDCQKSEDNNARYYAANYGVII
jgi:hypothetical protein